MAVHCDATTPCYSGYILLQLSMPYRFQERTLLRATSKLWLRATPTHEGNGLYLRHLRALTRTIKNLNRCMSNTSNQEKGYTYFKYIEGQRLWPLVLPRWFLSSVGGGGGGFPSDSPDASVASSFEFEFSVRFPSAAAFAIGSMTSTDELFLNDQIRPMKLYSHLQRPQVLDLNEEEDDDDESERHPPEMAARGRDLKLRSRSIRRRARSHSPLRNAPLHWQMEVEEREDRAKDVEPVPDPKQIEAESATLFVSASSSRSSSTSSSSSSSSGRTSKKWIFLKDLLYRSKSEGRERGNTKEKFWHSISFSQSKSKSKPPPPIPPPSASAVAAADSSSSTNPLPIAAISGVEKAKSKDPSPPVSWRWRWRRRAAENWVGRRRALAPSPHERHYTANQVQTEEMRRKTFLPYRQGLLGCLGFTFRSYHNQKIRVLIPIPKPTGFTGADPYKM
ncbi:uncharacterized protein LOC103697981 [Phoenix dactylifera]|uniref:Uncharacterized protein LOC103697981 n=1 Tax=Phoenix dactylifera TaxID=42345 RepID=A0A8B9AWB2_PHODC|nr:uncharacterized protein LOC103697981 [Phoenix dactylifera]